MEQIVITVATITPPAAGKKQATLIATNGERWGVWPDKMAGYQPGATYKITKHTENAFQGKIFKTITESEIIPPATGVHRPTPAAPKTAQYVATAEDPTPRRIFICGAFNNLLANQNVNPLALEASDMIRIIGLFDQVWRNAVNRPQHSDDMNDEIPL